VGSLAALDRQLSLLSELSGFFFRISSKRSQLVSKLTISQNRRGTAMFEDALMESSSTIKTRSKYWSLPALVINCALLSAMVIWPLLHPEALPKQAMASLLVAPPAPPPAPPRQSLRTQARAESIDHGLHILSKIQHPIKLAEEGALPSPIGIVGIDNPAGNSAGDPIAGIVNGAGHTPVVQALPPPRVHLSSGVMKGNLRDKVAPQYPVIAREARVQGTVVLQAMISKTGIIENLRVLSGPPLLQQAALDAVRSWRYTPYQLNGEPVEVETTVEVIFNLGN
jgi:protein TonB